MVAAASEFITLNAPPSGTSTRSLAPGVAVRAGADLDVGRRRTAEYGTISIGAASKSSRPWVSSTLTTPTTARPGSKSDALARKYSSIVPCRSRWSRPRFVNTAASNVVPSTRCSASACDDTSITTERSPSSSIVASRAWSSGASGVVNAPESVPITPVGSPAARRIDATSALVVVLPFVPVMPTTRSAADGSPCTAAATGPSARRVSATTSWLGAADMLGREGMVDEQRSSALGDGVAARTCARRGVRRAGRRTCRPRHDRTGVVRHRRHGRGSSPSTSATERGREPSFSSPSVGARAHDQRFTSPSQSVEPGGGTIAELVDDRGHELAEQRRGRLATGVEAFLRVRRSTRAPSPADPRPGRSRRSSSSRRACRSR